MSDENVEVARLAFEAFNREGLPGLQRFFDPDIEWHTDRRAPEAGVYRGSENVAQYLEGIESLIGSDGMRVEIERITALDGEEDVFVQLTLFARTDRSDKEVPVSLWCFLIRARDRKAVRIRSFFDREDALEAAGLQE